MIFDTNRLGLIPDLLRWNLSLGLAFGTSIVWISCAATELLECLTTLGAAVGISPAILGVTVLAWGNSVGDLVADVVIARGGQPTMAVASCYAGPLFNMVMVGSSNCKPVLKAPGFSD